MGSSKIVLLVWYLDCGEIWRNELCCFARVRSWNSGCGHTRGNNGYDVAFSMLCRRVKFGRRDIGGGHGSVLPSTSSYLHFIGDF